MGSKVINIEEFEEFFEPLAAEAKRRYEMFWSAFGYEDLINRIRAYLKERKEETR